jgi:hypothetical protein
MLKNLSNFFGKGSSDQNVAPQPLWESEPSDQGVDSVSLEVIETIRELKCFLADGKMQVALFGSPSELPDGWLRNCPWDQVFRSYPNLLPLDRRLSLQEAQKLVPLLDGFRDDTETSDEPLPSEDPDESGLGSAQSESEKIPATAFRDWVKDVSESSGFEAKAVKSVAKALASEIQQRIDAGDSFKLGPLRFHSCSFSNNNKFTGFFSRVSRS